MTLIDLRYSKAEAKEEAKESRVGEYEREGSAPWGCCIRLEARELDALGIKGLPNVGDEWHITAVARVTQISQSSSTDMDDSKTAALSIEMMQVDSVESAAMEKAEGKQTPAKEMAELRSRTILGKG